MIQWLQLPIITLFLCPTCVHSFIFLWVLFLCVCFCGPCFLFTTKYQLTREIGAARTPKSIAILYIYPNSVLLCEERLHPPRDRIGWPTRRSPRYGSWCWRGAPAGARPPARPASPPSSRTSAGRQGSIYCYFSMGILGNLAFVGTLSHSFPWSWILSVNVMVLLGP